MRCRLQLEEPNLEDNHEKTAPHPIYLKDYLPSAYLIDEIVLRFELDVTETLVKSQLKVRKNPAYTSNEKNLPLQLNGEALTLIDIALNDRLLIESEYLLTEEGLTLFNLPAPCTLNITTKINPKENTALSGLYLSGNSFCTQCEAQGFRRITYCIDRPDILSLYTTTIVADSARYPYLLSNGNPIANGTLSDGRHYATWQDPFKKPCYLFALVAGDFDVVKEDFITQSKRKIAIALYVEKGFKDQTAHAMQSIKEAMIWDEKSYGREYDLDVYMLVAINDFNMGAMENKGLNIFNSKFILAKPETATDNDFIHISSVIAHEYFHNWTGNRITCRDWFQLSLKEGLTIFRDQSFTEEIILGPVARIYDVRELREIQFPEDAGPLSHSVRPESYIEINNFYTATVYNKGAEVLRMLQTLLSKEVFRKGMDRYFSRFDGQAVTIEDFINTMEEVSQIDLSQFRLWYSQAGTPVVTVEEDYDPNSQLYTLRFQQSRPTVSEQSTIKPLLIPIRMGLLDHSGQEISLMLPDLPPSFEKVLQLKNASMSFAFANIKARPVPSLLRNFSAPVKINFPYADDDLKFLCQHDTDAFNRYEAGNLYARRVILRLIKDYRQDDVLKLAPDFLQLVTDLLQAETKNQDLTLLAAMLSLPSEKSIGEEMEVIDVDAIHLVSEYMLTTIAQQLESLWLKIYHQYTAFKPYRFSREEIGKRSLKNCCLHYLLQLPDESLQLLGWIQFENSLATNMTDTLAALRGITNIDSPKRAEALELFYQKWKTDPLVVNKWFEIQAATKLPSALSEVKKLMRHEAFDFKNPNKVYALIGTFCQRNLYHFHNKNGEGYAFLKTCVQMLDRLNPQVAARMVKPLITFRRYDPERQQLMHQQLQEILADKKISKDVYEIVSKALK